MRKQSSTTERAVGGIKAATDLLVSYIRWGSLPTFSLFDVVKPVAALDVWVVVPPSEPLDAPRRRITSTPYTVGIVTRDRRQRPFDIEIFSKVTPVEVFRVYCIRHLRYVGCIQISGLTDIWPRLPDDRLPSTIEEPTDSVVCANEHRLSATGGYPMFE